MNYYLHRPHSSYPKQVQCLYCRTGTTFNRRRHMEKCLCQWLGNIQRCCRPSSWGSTHQQENPPNPPTTGPTCPQCSRICASEFGLRSHLRSLTSTSATLLAARRTRRTTASKQASRQLFTSIETLSTFAEAAGIQWCLRYNLYKVGNDSCHVISLRLTGGYRLLPSNSTLFVGALVSSIMHSNRMSDCNAGDCFCADGLVRELDVRRRRGQKTGV